MRVELKRHPETACAAVERLEAEISRPLPGRLAVRWLASGRLGGLRLPAAAAPARADGLWRHTCFEAFVRAPRGAGYHELNFAPSAQWAAYSFDGYRDGMRAAELVSPPRIETEGTDGALALRVSLDLGGLPELACAATWRLALSAVIEEDGGRLSYWALAHPPGKPDFHHPAGFVLELREASP